ncbi:MAG: hypothetical protein K2M06_06330, partial [Muribaculaceae bacterium]|nr:hypothetical protein [Muribaculaceae bacterium]
MAMDGVSLTGTEQVRRTCSPGLWPGAEEASLLAEGIYGLNKLIGHQIEDDAWMAQVRRTYAPFGYGYETKARPYRRLMFN